MTQVRKSIDNVLKAVLRPKMVHFLKIVTWMESCLIGSYVLVSL